MGPAALAFFAVFLGCLFGFGLLFGILKDLVGQPGSTTRLALTLMMVLAAAAVAVASWRRNARRVRSLRVEISGHPLRAGSRYHFAVSHPDPAELGRLRLELSRLEESVLSHQRGGKNTSRTTSTQGIIRFEDPEPRLADTVRRGYIDVPRRAVPSLALRHHWVEWSLVVRLGGRIPCVVKLPVMVEPSTRVPEDVRARARSTWETPATAAEPDPCGALWLEGEASSPRGGLLIGGYSVNPVDGRRLESVELSVLWETDKPGLTDLGVCHYEDRAAADGDDLSLYGTRSFHVKLPNGPPSFEGTSVKIRWLARLRLRYADGGGEVLREAPFRLVWAEV